MLDALPSHVAILDEHANIIAVNAPWKRFAQSNCLGAANFGVGANYLEICEAAVGAQAEDAPLVAKGLRRLLRDRKGEFRCDYPCHSPTEQRWFQLRATCLQDQSGFHLVLAHEPVTEIKQAQELLREAWDQLEERVKDRTAELARANEALRSSERRLGILAAATFEGIAITENARFVDANEQLARMLGYTREELVGREVQAFIPTEDLERVMPNIVRGQESLVEHQMVRKDGTRLMVEAHGQTVSVEGRPVRFTALRDITERQRLEEALARYTEELDRQVKERTAQLSDSVEELQHFSYTLLHDMRAPLRAMMSFVNLIEMKCAMACGQQEVFDYLKRIKESSERMDHLVRDALNYAKVLRRDFPLHPVRLLPLLHGILESYPELWPHQSEIHLAPDLPAVLGNEAVLTECFSNLLRNAIMFVAPGILPRVRVWVEELRHADCGVPKPGSGEEPKAGAGQTVPAGTGTAPAWVRVWVEDNGIGIPKEAQDSIFSMFHQLHPSELHPGTGIGLAIVRKGIERIGGRVGVESELGKGSRFWVELRAAKGPA